MDSDYRIDLVILTLLPVVDPNLLLCVVVRAPSAVGGTGLRLAGSPEQTNRRRKPADPVTEF
jgi:hypothetical protein